MKLTQPIAESKRILFMIGRWGITQECEDSNGALESDPWQSIPGILSCVGLFHQVFRVPKPYQPFIGPPHVRRYFLGNLKTQFGLIADSLQIPYHNLDDAIHGDFRCRIILELNERRSDQQVFAGPLA